MPEMHLEALIYQKHSDSLKLRDSTGEANLETSSCDFEQLAKEEGVNT